MMASDDKKNNFLEILVRLGPIIWGVKPAEILNIKLGHDLEKCKKCFKNYSKVEFIEIKKLEKYPRMQVLFYHKLLLQKTLCKKVNLDFLIKLGYPSKPKINIYINILKEKLRSKEFPHEIGVFLGYPLKDVLGFMGECPLELVAIEGWRYYGSKKLSELQYKKVRKAREDFRLFLRGLDHPEEFYNYL